MAAEKIRCSRKLGWCPCSSVRSRPSQIGSCLNNIKNPVNLWKFLVMGLWKQRALKTCYALPISKQALAELNSLQTVVQLIVYNKEENDTWTFQWGKQSYYSSKLYKLALHTYKPPITFSWIWKFKCTPRLKFFAWLILVDRLNTKMMLQRRHFYVQPNTLCIMCQDQAEEDFNHLVFGCPFVVACWQKIGSTWNGNVEIKADCNTFSNHWGIPILLKFSSLQVRKSEIWGMNKYLTTLHTVSTFGPWSSKVKFTCSSIELGRILESQFYNGLVQFTSPFAPSISLLCKYVLHCKNLFLLINRCGELPHSFSFKKKSYALTSRES